MLETGYSKEELKKRIGEKIEELVEGIDLIGSIDHFQILIKHDKGEISTEILNRYHEKV